MLAKKALSPVFKIVRNASQGKAYVIGVGMTKFEKPGRREDFDYPDMAREAGQAALADAGVSYSDVEHAAVGYVYGDSCCGQRAVYEIGLTGIPVYNVNNNCSTGSTALMQAVQLVKGGLADCTLALGFEKMERGSLSAKYDDRTPPLGMHAEAMIEKGGFAPAPMAAQFFGNAGKEHMEKFGTKQHHFTKIAAKNKRHSTNNPYSQFQIEMTEEQIDGDKKVFEMLSRQHCCPTSDGSGAAIIASEEFVKKHGLEYKAVEVVAQRMVTDLPGTFDEDKLSLMTIAGYDCSKKCAEQIYADAGITAEQVNVVELHDCFSANELITYEAIGLCPEGGAGEFIDAGQNTYGGRVVVNPSGGLISKGHPLGATGLAQCTELTWQILGMAGNRQVDNCQYALQHNIGLGSAVVMTLYKLGFPEARAEWLKNNQMPAHAQPKQGVYIGQAKPDAKHPDETKFKASAVFDGMKAKMEKDGEKLVKEIKGSYLFQISNGEGGQKGEFLVDLKNGSGSIKYFESGKGKGDCQIAVKDQDFVDMMGGKLDPQKAFMAGKIKVKGNMGLAMKLQKLK
jgi:sterol carrier protein 2